MHLTLSSNEFKLVLQFYHRQRHKSPNGSGTFLYQSQIYLQISIFRAGLYHILARKTIAVVDFFGKRRRVFSKFSSRNQIFHFCKQFSFDVNLFTMKSVYFHHLLPMYLPDPIAVGEFHTCFVNKNEYIMRFCQEDLCKNSSLLNQL